MSYLIITPRSCGSATIKFDCETEQHPCLVHYAATEALFWGFINESWAEQMIIFCYMEPWHKKWHKNWTHPYDEASVFPSITESQAPGNLLLLIFMCVGVWRSLDIYFSTPEILLSCSAVWERSSWHSSAFGCHLHHVLGRWWCSSHSLYSWTLL